MESLVIGKECGGLFEGSRWMVGYWNAAGDDRDDGNVLRLTLDIENGKFFYLTWRGRIFPEVEEE